jgi:CdiI immunity protein
LTRMSPSSFPELRRVFNGYLHEDLVAESGSAEAALRTFWGEAAADERRRFQREVRRLLAQTAALDFDDVRDLIELLGCRWVPPSREALVRLLTDVASFTKQR